MKTLLLGVIFAGSVGLWWHTRPYQHLLGHSTTDLQTRSSAQLHNIAQAARSLHGAIIRPGEEFSFNVRIGPRTSERGYVVAPAFMTATTVSTIGGGICQVSSSLYGASLTAGLTILERHAHYTPVASVLPGLDATVWFGTADLRLRNPYPWPIQVVAVTTPSTLSIQLRAHSAASPLPVFRQESWRDPEHLVVTVFRGEQRLSTDTYRVPHSTNFAETLDKELSNPLYLDPVP